MTERDVTPGVMKRFNHPNGSLSHFLVKDGVVRLTSVQPEHPGNPGAMTRAEVLAAWDAVTAEAKAEGLLG